MIPAVVKWGLAWPFGVAVVALAVAAAQGSRPTDRSAQDFGLLAAGFLGVPLVVVGFVRHQPRGRPAWARVALTLLVGVPVALAAVYFAFWVYVIGGLVAVWGPGMP
jgi:hypothetical protein